MAKKINLFHIGKKAAENVDQLSSKFQYKWLPSNYDFSQDENETGIFIEGQFNTAFGRAIFILESHADLLVSNSHLLVQLPAYQIFYDNEAAISSEIEKILTLKQAISVDMKEMGQVFQFINQQYLVRQSGYKLSNDFIKVQPNFDGTTRKCGNSYVELNGNFSKEFRQVISWKMTNLIKADEKMEFFSEVGVLSGEIELLFKIFLVKENTSQIVQVIEVPLARLQQGEKITFKEQVNTYINVSLYARGGTGKLRVSQVHVRKALADSSSMIPGGKKIIDSENLTGEVFYYFNAGDLKPPLAVYFSGYRPAEGFEGRRMMSSMGGGPYMLIADPRLEGGNFYLGSKTFEQKIVKTIQDKLKLLGFTSADLILSGLSMGTFGALYYASDLRPNSVIIGKPLANIGTIALNERVLRPNGFPTSLDMLFYNTGESTIQAAERLNKKFWDKFSAGDYSHTTFAVAYMKQDDYDKDAFPQLFKELKENRSTARVLYKGLTGRHNDNSTGINKWFLKQYRNILFNSFHRIMDDFE
ncbi:accessory Sec system protein Asp2 [Enterococcus raffinosus]|uniref:accessory Sec system protein Asp2 n=1 Tax=Enterococcus raffinosus TaxID=71452 RepID=UPI001C9699E4|nr:accessory Sec system protein Asp2 [Enterococcus raffinosus]QZO10890.1 accessory Sec system protein Asp2 [Enterococcus raffinosus]